MKDLANHQMQLLDAIFSSNHSNKNIANYAEKISHRGLKVYQSNAKINATRSLQAAYPVIAQLLGEAAFGHVAHLLWAQYPPLHGDLAQWGSTLAVLILKLIHLQSEPYLSDVAQVEWALHLASTASDSAPDLATFSLLSEHDPAIICLQLAPATGLIASQYPIASIVTAHLYGQPALKDVGEKLRKNSPETVIVWRQGLRPMMAACATGEAVFLQQILSGQSLLTALDAAVASDASSFDLNLWLPKAAQQGILLGAFLLQ